jgi:glycosyltransferase involved in cell wall biosynthesis
MKNTVSVALCTYNGANFISEQLISIGKQTMLPDEVVICDDNSADDTVNIIREISKGLPYTIELLINKRNLGIGTNFQKAMQACSGEIIIFSDQDDVWMPDKVEKTVQTFLQFPDCGVVFSNADVVSKDLKSSGYSLWDYIGYKETHDGFVDAWKSIERLARGNFITGSTSSVRHSLVEKIIPIPAAWLHDAWMAWMLMGECGIYGISKKLSLYRQHEHQVIGASYKPDLTNIKNTSIERLRWEISKYEILEKKLRQRSGESRATVLAGKKKRYLERRLLINEGPRLGAVFAYARNFSEMNYLRFEMNVCIGAKDLFSIVKRTLGIK